MDRKAWIVITLCALGMAANFWVMSKNREAAQVAAAAKAQAEANAHVAASPSPSTGAAPAPAAAATPVAQAAQPSVQPAAAAQVPEEKVTLTKGNVTFHFTSRGGGVEKVVIEGTDHVTLNKEGKGPVGALRREANGLDSTPYRIVERSDKAVVFEGATADGLVVRKSYSLMDADEHLLKLTISLTNQGAAPFHSEELYLYAGAAASLRPDEVRHPRVFWNDDGSAKYKDTNYFSKGWFSEEKTELRQNFTKLSFAGVMTRFHLTLISHVSKDDQPGKVWASRFLVDHAQDEYKDQDSAKRDYAMQASVSLPPVDIAPGGNRVEEYEIYMGPKEYHRIKDLGPQWDNAMFYGMFSPVSKVLTWMMRHLHDFTGNWGFAIVLLTLTVRCFLWPIHAKSQYTMKRMGLLAPKMKELQEKYKDDPQRQQTEVMKLYKDYGVNPVGGCLPLFLQMPIFFGFYSVLENAAELRGQPFIGWVHDLSIPDTVAHVMGYSINPLPIIMGITMILQMKLTPQPQTVDKTQKMMFTIMPFFFLYICYNFAAALALYWSTQNIFSIFQSWIMKLYMPEPKLEKKVRQPKPAGGPSLFQLPGAASKEKKGKKPPKLGG